MERHIQIAVQVVSANKIDNAAATNEDLQLSLLLAYQSIRPTRNSMMAKSKRISGDHAIANSFRVGASCPSKRNRSMVASIAEMIAVIADVQRNASADRDAELVHG